MCQGHEYPSEGDVKAPDVEQRVKYQPPLRREEAPRAPDDNAYDFVRTLAEGSYGDVHECVHVASGQRVAVKRFKTAHLDPQVWRLAMREVKVLRHLPRHPHVVDLRRAVCSQSSGRLFLVFELLDRSLLQELSEHPGNRLPGPLLKGVAWQLLHALIHCHDHKVVHRDIKPANVLISKGGDSRHGGSSRHQTTLAGRGTMAVQTNGNAGSGSGSSDCGSGGSGGSSAGNQLRVKLCDFGFARWLPGWAGGAGGGGGGDGTAHLPMSYEDGGGAMSRYVVTRWYRAPEVLIGDSYGTAVDIWSYGCTLAELAAGGPLFPGHSSLDQLCRIIRCLGPLPPGMAGRGREEMRLPQEAAGKERGRTLAERIGGTDLYLLQVISACLALDPRRRPTARDLAKFPYFAEMLYMTVPERAAAPPLSAASEVYGMMGAHHDGGNRFVGTAAACSGAFSGGTLTPMASRRAGISRPSAEVPVVADAGQAVGVAVTAAAAAETVAVGPTSAPRPTSQPNTALPAVNVKVYDNGSSRDLDGHQSAAAAATMEAAAGARLTAAVALYGGAILQRHSGVYGGHNPRTAAAAAATASRLSGFMDVSNSGSGSSGFGASSQHGFGASSQHGFGASSQHGGQSLWSAQQQQQQQQQQTPLRRHTLTAMQMAPAAAAVPAGTSTQQQRQQQWQHHNLHNNNNHHHRLRQLGSYMSSNFADEYAVLHEAEESGADQAQQERCDDGGEEADEILLGTQAGIRTGAQVVQNEGTASDPRTRSTAHQPAEPVVERVEASAVAAAGADVPAPGRSSTALGYHPAATAVILTDRIVNSRGTTSGTVTRPVVQCYAAGNTGSRPVVQSAISRASSAMRSAVGAFLEDVEEEGDVAVRAPGAAAIGTNGDVSAGRQHSHRVMHDGSAWRGPNASLHRASSPQVVAMTHGSQAMPAELAAVPISAIAAAATVGDKSLYRISIDNTSRGNYSMSSTHSQRWTGVWAPVPGPMRPGNGGTGSGASGAYDCTNAGLYGPGATCASWSNLPSTAVPASVAQLSTICSPTGVPSSSSLHPYELPAAVRSRLRLPGFFRRGSSSQAAAPPLYDSVCGASGVEGEGAGRPMVSLTEIGLSTAGLSTAPGLPSTVGRPTGQHAGGADGQTTCSCEASVLMSALYGSTFDNAVAPSIAGGGPCVTRGSLLLSLSGRQQQLTSRDSDTTCSHAAAGTAEGTPGSARRKHVPEQYGDPRRPADAAIGSSNTTSVTLTCTVTPVAAGPVAATGSCADPSQVQGSGAGGFSEAGGGSRRSKAGGKDKAGSKGRIASAFHALKKRLKALKV